MNHRKKVIRGHINTKSTEHLIGKYIPGLSISKQRDTVDVDEYQKMSMGHASSCRQTKTKQNCPVPTLTKLVEPDKIHRIIVAKR
jgi:hypothetical protein